MLSLIAFIIGLILVIPGVVALIRGSVNVKVGRTTEVRSIRGPGIAAVAVGLLFLLYASAYTQDPGEAIVTKSFTGNVVAVDTTPGLGFTAPWNSTISFNIRNQRIEMFDDNGSGGGKDGAAITAPLQGSSNASVSITVRYSIRPECVGGVYNQHKDQTNLEDNVLKPGTRDVVRVETAKFAPLDVKEQRAKLASNIQTSLSKAWKDDCIVVDNVDLGALALDPATETAISERNTRQLAVESARADLEKANIEAESTKVRAQADADADQIVRCGAVTTESTKIIAGKEVVSTVVVPKEGAACEERFNEQVLRSKYLETLREIGAAGNMIVVVPEGGQDTILQVPQPTK